jgi:hypothetical protein
MLLRIPQFYYQYYQFTVDLDGEYGDKHKHDKHSDLFSKSCLLLFAERVPRSAGESESFSTPKSVAGHDSQPKSRVARKQFSSGLFLRASRRPDRT